MENMLILHSFAKGEFEKWVFTHLFLYVLLWIQFMLGMAVTYDVVGL